MDAVSKEVTSLIRLKVFAFHPPGSEHKFPASEGWQYAPLIMVFDVKSEDQRYKARYCLGGHRGVHVTKTTPIYADNQGVIINATDPSSSLNKKTVMLAYHFVREHQAGKVISVRKIRSEDNVSDPLTKPLPSTVHMGHFGSFMGN